MKSKLTRAFVSVAILVFGVSIGCGGHGGVVQETDEMTFDQMAEMAAQETELSEQSAEVGGK